MRPWLLCLLPLVAGCAGNVADYIGPRGTIVTPQLIRFGFTLEQARCVGDAMGRSVRPVNLRRLVRAAAPVRRGAAAPDRLAPSDLVAVTGTMRRPEVRTSLEAAMRSCNAAASPVTVTTLTELPRPDGSFAGAAPAPVVRPPAWLNLGAAGSTQSIAIDASTIEQAETTRTAWFRLTDPGAPASDNAYLLVIDCADRTINAKARERRDPAGVVLERIDYPDNPLPVENGTVMEIAFLAMCT
jgi:hypothetical protein